MNMWRGLGFDLEGDYKPVITKPTISRKDRAKFDKDNLTEEQQEDIVKIIGKMRKNGHTCKHIGILISRSHQYVLNSLESGRFFKLNEYEILSKAQDNEPSPIIKESKIIGALEVRSMTAAYFSESLGINTKTMGSYLHGKTNPSFEIAKKITKALGLKITDLNSWSMYKKSHKYMIEKLLQEHGTLKNVSIDCKIHRVTLNMLIDVGSDIRATEYLKLQAAYERIKT